MGVRISPQRVPLFTAHPQMVEPELLALGETHQSEESPAPSLTPSMESWTVHRGTADNPTEQRTSQAAYVTVTATLIGSASAEDIDVTVSVAGNTATAGTDFSAVTDFTVTIAAGSTEGSATFNLTPVAENTAPTSRRTSDRASLPIIETEESRSTWP